MANDTARLREHVRMAMHVRGMTTRDDLARAAGVSVATIGNVLAGRGLERRQAVEAALGWRAGSIREVLAGEDPALLLADDRDRADDEPDLLDLSLLRPDTREHIRSQYLYLMERDEAISQADAENGSRRSEISPAAIAARRRYLAQQREAVKQEQGGRQVEGAQQPESGRPGSIGETG